MSQKRVYIRGSAHTERGGGGVRRVEADGVCRHASESDRQEGKRSQVRLIHLMTDALTTNTTTTTTASST